MTMNRIMDFLVHRLETTQFVQDTLHRRTQAGKSNEPINRRVEDAISECIYQLQTILNVMDHCPLSITASLGSPVILSEAGIGPLMQAFNEGKEGPTSLGTNEEPSLLEYLLATTMFILEDRYVQEDSEAVSEPMQKTVGDLLERLCLAERNCSLPSNFEDRIVRVIMHAIDKGDLLIQEKLLDTLLILLGNATRQPLHEDYPDRSSFSQLNKPADQSNETRDRRERTTPPPALLDCIISGISSNSSQAILDRWIKFLNEYMPSYQSQLFQILIPLVECFLKSSADVFETLQASFSGIRGKYDGQIEPITVLNILLNGLEQTLAVGHEQLALEEAVATPIKGPEQAQGFFGNMVSGVFASGAQKPRSSTANDRLTVLICFKDAIRHAFGLWRWGEAGSERQTQAAASTASFNYMTVRLRNRARRVIEHLITVEPLECLETLIEFWRRSGSQGTNTLATVLNLLQALDAARPKNTLPTLFNALYSRTSPASLDPRRTSTLTSDISPLDLGNFLVSYTKSIDDDALDEIWVDCMAFLRNVLGNPMPQRQVLSKLLEFVAVLGEKIDNTNFGEQRRMRREIGVS